MDVEVVEVSVRAPVDWSSLARGWAERASESMDMSSSELDSEELRPAAESFRRFRREDGFLDSNGFAHSGTG